jgi:hypothetical protein
LAEKRIFRWRINTELGHASGGNGRTIYIDVNIDSRPSFVGAGPHTRNLDPEAHRNLIHPISLLLDS